MLRMVKIFAVIALAVMVFAQPALAREFADIYTECGLGAMIAPRNEAVAAVTNVTWDLGTTAISSNISSPDTCKGGQERMASFIYDSYEPLEKDLASGKGEYLDMLMTLAEIDTQSQQDFIAGLRADFAKIVAGLAYTSQSRFDQAAVLYKLVYEQVETVS